MRWSPSSRPAAALLAVLAAGTVARAQESPAPERSAEERRPIHQTATGTLTAYDPLTRVLTVRSATGSSDFLVAADARFWLGNRRLPVSQLKEHAGAQVTVAWSAAGGVRRTHTVRVTDTLGAGSW
jgi:phage baseplate assembly protein gpV